MVNPRIIIADTDSKYIIPLQQRFIEKYYDNIDLEIITDRIFFDEVFSAPQKVDILVVSEELYSSSLSLHNIGNIFVMTEQPSQQIEKPSSITFIYKYTSLKEIFNVISGKGSSSLELQDVEHKETQIALVCSASGGVGKTTVALGICSYLSKNYKRVLYINAARLQCFQSLLVNQEPIAASDVYAKLTMENTNIYSAIKHVVRKEGFSYLPPFKTALMSYGIDFSVYENITVSAKNSGEYDCIVIDVESAFDEEQVRLIDIADKVVVVTSQSKYSVKATNLLVSNLNGVTGDKFIFVCNNFVDEAPNYLISPAINKKYSVVDYIGHYSAYDDISINDLSNDKDIQKIAYLII